MSEVQQVPADVLSGADRPLLFGPGREQSCEPGLSGPAWRMIQSHQGPWPPPPAAASAAGRQDRAAGKPGRGLPHSPVPQQRLKSEPELTEPLSAMESSAEKAAGKSKAPSQPPPGREPAGPLQGRRWLSSLSGKRFALGGPWATAPGVQSQQWQ